MNVRFRCLKTFLGGEEGAAMVEYGLILALVAIIAMAGVALLGTQSSTLFSTVGNTL